MSYNFGLNTSIGITFLFKKKTHPKFDKDNVLNADDILLKSCSITYQNVKGTTSNKKLFDNACILFNGFNSRH